MLNILERIREQLNRGMVPGDRNSAADLNHAVPVTNILDVTAARDRAELARQGSLAERSLPSSLAARRQNSNPSDPGVASGGSTSHSQVDFDAQNIDCKNIDR